MQIQPVAQPSCLALPNQDSRTELSLVKPFGCQREFVTYNSDRSLCGPGCRVQPKPTHVENTMIRSLLTLLVVALALVRVASADIKIDSYTNATNDRFTNSSSFVLNSYSLSGVGQANNGRWATLISPNVVISAWHYFPATNSQISFYIDNNPGSVPIVRTVTSTSTRVGSTDLWIGVLNAPVTGATYYQIADELLTGPTNTLVAAGTFQNVNAYMVGRSPKSNSAFRDQAVGRNRISGYKENVVFNGADNDSLLLAYNQNTSPDYVQFESHLVSGDSGGPFFIERNGKLVLLGTNGFVETFGGQFYSGVNYVGNQASFIRNFINVNGVPEPSAGLLLCGLSGIFFASRRSRLSPGRRPSS